MPVADPIRYAVDLTLRRQHLVRVAMTVPADLSPGARIVLPTWTPGSYVVRNHVHWVQWIRASGPAGERVGLTPDGDTAWRLPADVDGPIEIVYELYANQLTVRTNHVDDHHALLVAAATFAHVDGARARRHVVHLVPDAGGRVRSLLPAGDELDTYEAEDALHLVDSAFEVGDLRYVDYRVADVPHRFVWAGHGGRPDLDRIAADAAATGEAAARLFGGDLPVARYTFLCLGSDDGGGGLEHRDGAVLQVPTRTFQDDDAYARFQTLMAHEYLHLWNVKRLVPAELVAPDLVRPTHTTLLWVAEGWTAYYDELVLLRAGVWSLDRFLDTARDLIQHVVDTPEDGRLSPREASYRAWTKLYVRDENSRNSAGDYYRHGALVAWCLDLLIRRERPDGDGLDDALRLLWKRRGGIDVGYTESDVEDAVTDAAGADLSRFFDHHVAGAQLPPVESLLDVVGLRVTVDEGAAGVPDLGVETAEDDQGVTFASVLRGRPAWRAGVTGGDRLLAIDGLKVARGDLDTALRAHEAGETVEMAVFRGPRLLTIAVTLGDPRPKRTLVPVRAPSARQRATFQRWTGHDLPGH